MRKLSFLISAAVLATAFGCSSEPAASPDTAAGTKQASKGPPTGSAAPMMNPMAKSADSIAGSKSK